MWIESIGQTDRSAFLWKHESLMQVLPNKNTDNFEDNLL
jgi:hypothetical protein